MNAYFFHHTISQFQGLPILKQLRPLQLMMCRQQFVPVLCLLTQRFILTTWSWLYVPRSKVGLKMLLCSSKHSFWPIRIHLSPVRCLKKYLSSVAGNRTPRVLVVGNSLVSKSTWEARSPSALSAITSGSLEIHFRMSKSAKSLDSVSCFLDSLV